MAEQYERCDIPLGGRVKAVAEDSPASRAGVHVGDRVVAVDGHVLSDVLDWMWYADYEAITLTIVDPEGAERSVELVDQDGEDWGIDFEDALFDGIKRCANNCAFCFMKQLPANMRSTLSIKDDDYRLSFLQGNFITLTNLNESEVARIIEQRLSPLYISFHAVDADVREQLIGKNHARALEHFEKLVQANIEMHVQIVLVPDVNDGAELDKTLTYLYSRRPAVASVGIVPVAYTDVTTEIAGRPPKSFNDQTSAAQVISQVQRYQFWARAGKLGQGADLSDTTIDLKPVEGEETWVYLADEFYIYAHAPFPSIEWYDDFVQYENGIGMVWGFVEDLQESYDSISSALATVPEGSDALTIVIGELATDTMLGALSALRAGGKVRVLPVKNRFFGGNVSVTGLLTAQDILQAIAYDQKHINHETVYAIPDTISNTDGLTLDDYTFSMIQTESQATITFVSADAQGLVAALQYASSVLAEK